MNEQNNYDELIKNMILEKNIKNYTILFRETRQNKELEYYVIENRHKVSKMLEDYIIKKDAEKKENIIMENIIIDNKIKNIIEKEHIQNFTSLKCFIKNDKEIEQYLINNENKVSNMIVEYLVYGKIN